MANVLIYGHSFVARLDNFMTKENDPRMDRNLGLGSRASVIFDGFGGRKVSDLESDEDKIASHRPDILIIMIGGNDFGPECSPSWAARRTLEVCGRLAGLGIRCVLCKAMPRFAMPRCVARQYRIPEGLYLDIYFHQAAEWNAYCQLFAGSVGTIFL